MDSDELKHRYEALRERTSRLSAAILRVNASLEPHTVLREVLESACALTGARYGLIAAIDDDGKPQDLVTSGLTEEESGQLRQLPDGVRLFEHLRDLPSPLRVADVPAYVRSLGYDWDVPGPWTSFQATPMRHRGVLVGSFFLAEKAGGHEFTDDDEEVLVLFASQAAAAISNARTHRAEQRARADLEALVETTPIGVVVFDPATSRPVSLNREAGRILGRLQGDRSLQELLDAVVYRRADGRDINLEELRVSAGLDALEKVRAEEVVISVPGGASVSALIDATPIPAASGNGMESLVVTMQDLEPLHELERQRARFVGMVSHELRAPLAAIKGCAAAALDGRQDLDRAEALQFFRIVDAQADRMRGLIRDLLDAGRIETGTLSVAPEPAHLAALVDEARNTFVRGGGRHRLDIDLTPDLPPVEADRDRIVQVLNNLLANAARHSPESTPIGIHASLEGAHVSVSVADRGEGIAADRLPHLFSKHAALADAPHGAGGGLGLPICRGLVEAHGGRIHARSPGPGRGTTITFTLPTSERADPGPARSSQSSGQPADTRLPVLVLDDDPAALRQMRHALGSAGFAPTVTADPAELPRLIRTSRPRLAILDLVLPDTDGIELMTTVGGLRDVPVIFVSAYGRDETVSDALEAGAVDYIVKPFSNTELVARVRAALRRRAEPESLTLGELSIRFASRQVSARGRALSLTATEYELLRVLAVNAGSVCTYDALQRNVWPHREGPDPELVRNYIRRLRRKLGDDPTRPEWIFNERGVGYRFGAAD